MAEVGLGLAGAPSKAAYKELSSVVTEIDAGGTKLLARLLLDSVVRVLSRFRKSMSEKEENSAIKGSRLLA